ncbi:hypothetical protein JXA88_16765 [Candidatus Fermentibacteria bacterium]|nr:hypothetical protein [Candidatus Fermentibacteria bacterium]
MLLILFGPSCSGKSSVARIIAERTGASVWTGNDYLRLAKTEPEAWKRFEALLERAASAGPLGPGSVIFAYAGPLPEARSLPTGPEVRRLRFIASQEVLRSRFSPRVGGRVTPAISSMLARVAEQAALLPADAEYDTSTRCAEDVATEIMRAVHAR